MPAFGLPLASAYVVIVAVTGTIWTLLTLGIRVFIRLRIHGPLGWDDFFCMVATSFAVISAGVSVAQTDVGLGHRIDSLLSPKLNEQHLLAWINNFFYLSALSFSMLSTCCLVARVMKRTAEVRFTYTIAALDGLWAISSLLAISFACKLPRPWIISPRSWCANIYHVWLGITIAKALLELANLSAALKLLWSVRIPWRAKLAVFAAFMLRLLVLPPTLTRLRYLQETLHSTDWSYSRVRVVIITQVVLHVSVILATVPCIRPWLVALESHGLKAPAEAHAEARQVTAAAPRTISSSAPVLPITRPKLIHQTASDPGLHARRNKTQDTLISDRGPAGHRKRVEAWPVKTYPPKGTYHAKAEYVPPSQPQPAARKESKGSSASERAITRIKSFSVDHGDAAEHFDATEQMAETPPGSQDTQLSIGTAGTCRTGVLQDVGGLLQQSYAILTPKMDKAGG